MSSISHSDALYQPTSGEIANVLASIRPDWPTLESRICKAEEILLDGGLTLDPVAWQKAMIVLWKVQSQSCADGTYTVVGCTHTCNCPDRGLRMADLRFCKHSIAVSAYRRILKERFNEQIQAREIDLGILHNGEFHAYAKGMGYVQAAKLNGSYSFVDAASAVRFSIWLAKQGASEFVSLFDAQRELVAA